MKCLRRFSVLSLSALLCLGAVASAVHAEAWSFGVISDTQQTQSGGLNSVATNIIAGVNAQFIARGVDFVVQVGDLGDNGSVASLQTRLAANADLAAAGIEFYGIRGNHESGTDAAAYFQANYLPSSTADVAVSVAAFDSTSYSITYKDAKLILLDIKATDGSTTAMDAATAWMDGELSADDHTQAFVFQHKNLLGQNHKDNAFGSGNDANTAQQNEFYRVLATNNVRYDISGHDHMNHRALCTSPDGQYQVTELITQSDSTKFYTASSGFSSRETPFSDEQNKIGYYLFTVDGPRVTGEYWATTPVGNDLPANPVWTLQETFGYSLNGKQFLVGRGESYAGVADQIAAGDGFVGTSMSILDGVNTVTATAEGSRACSDDLNTGWAERPDGFLSDVLSLWGMANALGSEQTDTFVLAMDFLVSAELDPAEIYLATLDADGFWVNAVDTNFGGTKQGVLGAWNASSGLGTYGVDLATGTAWAVVNHNSDFAVVPEPATLAFLALGGAALLYRRQRR